MSFVLIDRLLSLAESQVVAEKEFHGSEPLFVDHFPGSAIVPGSLLLESMAQTCGWWITWKSGETSKSALLMADRVQFRHFVKPGERIRLEGRMLQFVEGRARFEAQALVGEKTVAKAELSFAVFKIDDPSGPFHGGLLQKWIEEKFKSLGGPAAAERSV